MIRRACQQVFPHWKKQQSCSIAAGNKARKHESGICTYTTTLSDPITMIVRYKRFQAHHQGYIKNQQEEQRQEELSMVFDLKDSVAFLYERLARVLSIKPYDFHLVQWNNKKHVSLSYRTLSAVFSTSTSPTSSSHIFISKKKMKPRTANNSTTKDVVASSMRDNDNNNNNTESMVLLLVQSNAEIRKNNNQAFSLVPRQRYSSSSTSPPSSWSSLKNIMGHDDYTQDENEECNDGSYDDSISSMIDTRIISTVPPHYFQQYIHNVRINKRKSNTHHIANNSTPNHKNALQPNIHWNSTTNKNSTNHQHTMDDGKNNDLPRQICFYTN